MTEKLKKSESELKQQFAMLLEMYNARELEDTVFEIFNDDSTRPNLFPYEREKRAMLHDALRNLFRTIDHHPKILKKLQ